MRVGYAGTPDFARVALTALLDAGHEVALVLTQPDRPAGRGLQLLPSPVKELAVQRGLTLAQPRSLRLDGKFPGDAAAAQRALERAAPEVLVVAAYGLLLPPWVLALPQHGALNIHGSLLPRWRGAAPIQRAIEAGDTQTGITLMEMDAGLDTGAMLLTEATPVGADETAATLQDRLATIGARLAVRGLELLAQGRLHPRPQPCEGVTYARKIDKREGVLDWTAPAVELERRLRAFDPFPGCSTVLAGQTVKVWRARVAPGSGVPGQVLLAGGGRLVIACGDGALELLQLQRAGGRRIAAREFLQRYDVAIG